MDRLCNSVQGHECRKNRGFSFLVVSYLLNIHYREQLSAIMAITALHISISLSASDSVNLDSSIMTEQFAKGNDFDIMSGSCFGM